MTTFNLIVTIFTSIITLISLILGFIKDTAAVRGIFGNRKNNIKPNIASDNRREYITESGLIIPKPYSYHTRERITYEN